MMVTVVMVTVVMVTSVVRVTLLGVREILRACGVLDPSAVFDPHSGSQMILIFLPFQLSQLKSNLP